MEDLQRAMATHGEELVADIANYTNVQAEMLISRVIEPHEIMASIASSAL